MIGIIDSIIQNSNIKVYGAKGGIQGLLQNSIVRLDNLPKNVRTKIKHTPGAILGTCRTKIDENHLNSIFDVLKNLNIRYLFCIGGNGTMYVTNLIGKFAKQKNYNLFVIGVPKSIDNDLHSIDHSPGYISAAKFLISCCNDLLYDITSYEAPKVTILETMGRNTGWLAASCSMATTFHKNYEQLIYIPEAPFDINHCIKKVEQNNKNQKHTLIVVSEGIQYGKHPLFSNYNTKLDVLKRPRLGGVSYLLKQIIEENIDVPTRNIDTSIWQRCSTQYISTIDLEEAYTLGYNAWKLVTNGINHVMISLKRSSNLYSEYIPTYFWIELDAVSGIERKFPTNWYDVDNNKIKTGFQEYINPLVEHKFETHSIFELT